MLAAALLTSCDTDLRRPIRRRALRSGLSSLRLPQTWRPPRQARLKYPGTASWGVSRYTFASTAENRP